MSYRVKGFLAISQRRSLLEGMRAYCSLVADRSLPEAVRATVARCVYPAFVLSALVVAADNQVVFNKLLSVKSGA